MQQRREQQGHVCGSVLGNTGVKHWFCSNDIPGKHSLEDANLGWITGKKNNNLYFTPKSCTERQSDRVHGLRDHRVLQRTFQLLGRHKCSIFVAGYFKKEGLGLPWTFSLAWQLTISVLTSPVRSSRKMIEASSSLHNDIDWHTYRQIGV